jgi:hypothetical protein
VEPLFFRVVSRLGNLGQLGTLVLLAMVVQPATQGVHRQVYVTHFRAAQEVMHHQEGRLVTEVREEMQEHVEANKAKLSGVLVVMGEDRVVRGLTQRSHSTPIKVSIISLQVVQAAEERA